MHGRSRMLFCVSAVGEGDGTAGRPAETCNHPREASLMMIRFYATSEAALTLGAAKIRGPRS